MNGEVSVCCDRLGVGRITEHDSQFWVSGPGRPNGIRIEFARVPAYGSVAHVTAPIECQALYMPNSYRQFHWSEAFVRLPNALCDKAGELRHVFHGQIVLAAFCVVTR